MTTRILMLMWILLGSGTNPSLASKILGISPSSSYSQQQPMQAIMKALAARGHQVTLITTIPSKNPIKNHQDIDVSFTYRSKDYTKLRHLGAFTLLHDTMRESSELCEEQLSSPAVQELIRWRNETFDAIIFDQSWFQCYYALVKYYNYPVLIGFLSAGSLPNAMDSVGNPDDAVLNPSSVFPFTDKMTIDERFKNVLYTTWARIYYYFWHLPRSQRIADRWVPGTSVYDIDRNFSLIILGTNYVFGYPKPLLPNVIEVHSLHIEENPGPLPKDIQDFLDNANEGAIYFSLGSSLQTHQLPVRALTLLCDALSSVKQRVLWKHDGGMPVHPSNIKFVKWVPQQAVLAHPRVIAFAMQGGLRSFEEAVHYAVPLVVIPFFGIQNFNARKILDSGIGLTLNVDTMTNRTIARALREIIENKTYFHNIKRMSAIVRGEQVKPLNKAAWYIEHVLKYPDCRHLKYYGNEMAWSSYYMIDFHTCAAIFCWSVYIVLNQVNHLVEAFLSGSIYRNVRNRQLKPKQR